MYKSGQPVIAKPSRILLIAVMGGLLIAGEVFFFQQDDLGKALAGTFLGITGTTANVLSIASVLAPKETQKHNAVMASSDFKVGQHIIAKINGIPTESKVRAVLDTTEGVKLIVDFGHEQTATIHERDVVRD